MRSIAHEMEETYEFRVAANERVIRARETTTTANVKAAPLHERRPPNHPASLKHNITNHRGLLPDQTREIHDAVDVGGEVSRTHTSNN